jgi:hypothetical protein
MINSNGNVIERGFVDVTDEMLQKWVTKYSEGYAKVVIAIGVEVPDKTTLSTISKTVDRIRKLVPAKTNVTIWVLDLGK